MSEPDVQRYLDGIESQHQRPRFMSTLRMILEKIDDATMVAKDMPSGNARRFHLGSGHATLKLSHFLLPLFR